MTNELKQVISSYYRVRGAWTSGAKNTNDYLAATCLFEYLSYRLLESDRKDILLGFRIIIRVLRRIFRSHQGIKCFDPKANELLISGTIAIQDRVTEYIRRSGKANLHSYVAKDVMTFDGVSRLQLLVHFLPFAISQSFRAMFSPYRQGVALSIAEVAEIAYVLHYIRKNNIQKVYDFVPYEIDSNFMYVVFQEAGINMVKVPSSGPLATHHKILLADEVVFSTPYHLEEYQKFRDSFRVKQTLAWPPERAYQYYPKYKNTPPQAEPSTIGFYSHGEWLRRIEKHSAYGGRIGEAEETILKYLGRYVNEHPHIRLIVFPHPREMRPDVAEQMRTFYRNAVGHDKFEIAQFTGGTTQNFDKTDMAVAAFSTILYERLYCGYKTLIGNMAISEFPMNASPLNNICFRTYEGMSQLISEYSAQPVDYFFRQTKLEPFRAVHYPEP
ncbi:MAG: hypothetical protein K1X54_05605 [Flavobacteriales bacterium]|nr:hypothetical protein [Flavobacteriales bacterium]